MGHATQIRLAAVLLPWLALATIIDRIVIAIGTQVITESELELNIRLTAFMNQDPLEFGPERRRAIAEKLIEQKLVLKELDFSKFPRPSIDEAQPRLLALTKRLFGDDPAAAQAALQKYGITEDDLKQYLLWQITFFRFLDFRFRPGIQVSETDIQDYFQSKILPLAQKANPGKSISLDEYHDRIERVLAAQREDGELQVWLKDTRARAKVEYRDETLKPPPPAGVTP
jgi:hypothetical protein